MATSLHETLRADGWLKEANAIGGTWKPAETGATFDVSDPATGR